MLEGGVEVPRHQCGVWRARTAPAKERSVHSRDLYHLGALSCEHRERERRPAPCVKGRKRGGGRRRGRWDATATDEEHRGHWHAHAHAHARQVGRRSNTGCSWSRLSQPTPTPHPGTFMISSPSQAAPDPHPSTSIHTNTIITQSSTHGGRSPGQQQHPSYPSIHSTPAPHPWGP